jgi:hypothetical protein
MIDILNKDLRNCMCSQHKNKSPSSVNPSLRYGETLPTRETKTQARKFRFFAKIRSILYRLCTLPVVDQVLPSCRRPQWPTLVFDLDTELLAEP